MARQFISKNNDPIELFSNWFSDARKSETINPEAMALATSGLDGKPSVRMVLLKDFNQNGFIFYTPIQIVKKVNNYLKLLMLHYVFIGNHS